MSEFETHERRIQLLARILRTHGPEPGDRLPCPYLPGRDARHLTLSPSPVQPGLYHALMDLNFRRMGPVFYRPQCEGCRECKLIRIPVSEFHPSRSQRRCWKRNADVVAEVASPRATEEKRVLYERYLGSRHDGQMDGSPEEFDVLYTSLVDTVEILYRVEGRLVATALVDVEPLALSAVYCYYEPDLPARSLGAFNVLWTIEECRRRNAPYLYLGFYVRDCRKMNYKAHYQPCEILESAGRWVRYESRGMRPGA